MGILTYVSLIFRNTNVVVFVLCKCVRGTLRVISTILRKSIFRGAAVALVSPSVSTTGFRPIRGLRVLSLEFLCFGNFRKLSRAMSGFCIPLIRSFVIRVVSLAFRILWTISWLVFFVRKCLYALLVLPNFIGQEERSLDFDPNTEGSLLAIQLFATMARYPRLKDVERDIIASVDLREEVRLKS